LPCKFDKGIKLINACVNWVSGALRKTKKELGAKNSLYPMPTTIVGAMVNGKPNYITIAHVGIMDMSSVSLGMNKSHYTNAGIKTNGTFSVNIPSVKMVKRQITAACSQER
jgi:flavin reductase (DIM6/NTAB) family NADH-FMN oxidoreductase RutF